MYLIIINSSNFDDFLSVHNFYIKIQNKVCCIVICYCELKLKKNDKMPVKQSSKYIQIN